MDHGIRPSFYNYITALPNGERLLFNFYTLNLMVVKPEDVPDVERLLAHSEVTTSSEQTKELQELLVQKGFIIDADIDERDLLRQSHYASVTQRDQLTLTIAPTLDCNFRCVYCYQHRSRGGMTPEVEEAVLRFTEEQLAEEGILYIVWFGGEPLLQMDVIERLTKGLRAICERKKSRYSARIITNAYLLDAACVERLLGCDVSSAQVTLDGPADVHDARRPTKNGRPTFSRILNNLIEASQRMNISVRMNVDQRNQDRILDLMDILKEKGLREKVGFYLGKTYPYTDVCADVATCCIGDMEFNLLSLETLMDMVEQGFTSLFNMPTSHDHHCVADCEHTYVITPTGGLAKCWNEIDSPDAWCGHLLEPLTTAMLEIKRRWQSIDPFERECADCLLLPICMGGCPYVLGLTGERDCHPWKHHIDESLVFYYFFKEEERQVTIARHFQTIVQSVKELANK